jgi:hypothetical protein
MNLYLRRVDVCPGCETPSNLASCLFGLSILGEPCSLLKCNRCGLVFKELFPTLVGLEKIYSPDYVHFAQDEEDYDKAELCSAKQKLIRCCRLLGRRAGASPIRLLDIGCGTGKYVRMAKSLGYEAHGIDPFLPNHLESNLLRRASPESVESSFYDVALLLNVAEHLTEPRRLFASVYSLLKPGGVLLLTCPYGDSVARRYYKDKWIHMSLDEHLLFWTPTSLKNLLGNLGFAGRISYRVAGSPFPFGRDKSASSEKSGCVAGLRKPASHPNLDVQARIWRGARRLQRTQILANIVRGLVHYTRTGDYLEFGVRKDNC